MPSDDRKILTQIESAAGRLTSQIDGAVLVAKRGSTSYRLALSDLKPVARRAGWLYLAVAVCGQSGAVSRTPLAIGIVSAGGRGVKPWFELRLYPSVELADGSTLDARAAELEAEFVKLLGTLVPPGGHLMIEYESSGQGATHAELLLRVPPAASYLGFLMYQAGFRGEFKDWYISEGGHEGPRKLQANKSPTPSAARVALQAHRADLEAFVKRPLPQAAGAAATILLARGRARTILKDLS